eukprot:TRINITY_DN2343_c0_g2_i2.p1 TRINITY_DN2343_c0_g2~~TRINITY_DN2343_c0_g2_i2.p1  ORF type:complete len:290 (+),score=15.72 TRINITY_DN2343_c0_g2_i2:199-1068(+)
MVPPPQPGQQPGGQAPRPTPAPTSSFEPSTVADALSLLLGVVCAVTAVLLATGVVWVFWERRRRSEIARRAARLGRYSSSILDCFQRPTLCVPACIWPCYLAALNRAEVDDRDCEIGDACCIRSLCQAQYTTRQSIRAQYGLESDCADLPIALCCTPCGMAQDAIEMEHRRTSAYSSSSGSSGKSGVPLYSLNQSEPSSYSTGGYDFILPDLPSAVESRQIQSTSAPTTTEMRRLPEVQTRPPCSLPPVRTAPPAELAQAYNPGPATPPMQPYDPSPRDRTRSRMPSSA